MSLRTCTHIKSNGVQCRSAALRNSIKCYFHHKHRRRLKRDVILQSLNTKRGRLTAIDQILHAALTDRIDPEVARTLLYGIQTTPNS
ncbi:MAG: hypothetical protein JWN45_3249 [Acidobacteriaceae bacterium]|nr:hypothetical protein [Acidobacteriaceae bacterium]